MNPAVLKTWSSFFLFSFPFPLLPGQPSVSIWCQTTHSHQSQIAQSSRITDPQEWSRWLRHCNQLWDSVIDKGQPNFLEGMPQKADVDCVPACASRSKQLQIALKRTGKPEATSQAPPQGTGYPTGRSTPCWGRVLSPLPCRHTQLHGQTLWAFTALSHSFVYMFLSCTSPLEQNPLPRPKNPERL